MAKIKPDGKTELIVKLLKEINPETDNLWVARDIAKALNVSRGRVYAAKSYHLSRRNLRHKGEKFVGQSLDADAGRAAWKQWADNTDSVREEIENYHSKTLVGIGGDGNSFIGTNTTRCPNCKHLLEENRALKAALAFYIKQNK